MSSAPALLTLDVIRAAAVAEARLRDECRATGRPLGPDLSGFSRALANFFDVRALPHSGFGLLHGRAGAAKTAAATAIATTAKVPAVIVEAEMRPVRILERIVAAHSGIHLGHFVDGTLTAAQIDALMCAAVADTPLVSMLDATATHIDMPEISTRADEWRRVHGSDHVLVVLDSLQSWALRAHADVRDEYPRTNAAIDEIMTAGVKAGAFFLVISERSNAGADAAANAHGKGSGRSGYAGEVTLGLDVAGDYDPRTGKTPLNLTIAKNRWGAQAITVPLWFDGRVQRFFDAVEPHTNTKKHRRNAANGAAAAPQTPSENLPTLDEYIQGVPR